MGVSWRNPLLSSQIASKISILEAERNRMPSLSFDNPRTQCRQHFHQCVTVSVKLNHLYMEETGCLPTAITIVHRRGYGIVSPHPHLWTCRILRFMRHKNFTSIWPMCMCKQIIQLHDFDRMCIYQHGQTCIEVFHHKNQWQWLGITLEEDVLEMWITLKPGSVLSTVKLIIRKIGKKHHANWLNDVPVLSRNSPKFLDHRPLKKKKSRQETPCSSVDRYLLQCSWSENALPKNRCMQHTIRDRKSETVNWRQKNCWWASNLHNVTFL